MRAVLPRRSPGGRVPRGRVPRGWRAGRAAAGRGGDQVGDGGPGGLGGGVVEPGQVAVWVSTWTWRSTSAAMAGSANPARISAAWARRSASRARRAASAPGRAACSWARSSAAQLVQPPGREVDPDAAGGGLRRHLVIGGQAQLDADALGRVQPAQRGQPLRSARPAVAAGVPAA